MKLLLRVITATFLTFPSLGGRQNNKPLNQSLNDQEMANTFNKKIKAESFDPLEEYYNSIGNHGEYLTRCPNCGLYTTGYYCSADCEDNYRIAFS